MPGVLQNPNFNYTSWDNFGVCMLNSFSDIFYYINSLFEYLCVCLCVWT